MYNQSTFKFDGVQRTKAGYIKNQNFSSKNIRQLTRSQNKVQKTLQQKSFQSNEHKINGKHEKKDGEGYSAEEEIFKPTKPAQGLIGKAKKKSYVHLVESKQ